MKKAFLALLVTVLAATSVAWAAEETKWSGFYFSLNAGMGRHEANWSDNDYYWHGGTLTNPYYTILPGGAFGVNVQNGSAVFGFEVDGAFGFTENKTEYEMDPTPPPATWDVTKTDKLGLLVTIRARMGFALDNALLYLTAGAGLPSAAHTWIEQGHVPESWQTFYNSKLGMVVGAGVEYRLSGGLSFKAEFISFNNGPKVEPNKTTPPWHMSVDESIGILRIGFSVLF